MPFLINIKIIKYFVVCWGKILSHFINYTDMKNIYPTQVIDLRLQVDHVNLKKIQLFEEKGVLLKVLDCF